MFKFRFGHNVQIYPGAYTDVHFSANEAMDQVCNHFNQSEERTQKTRHGPEDRYNIYSMKN